MLEINRVLVGFELLHRKHVREGSHGSATSSRSEPDTGLSGGCRERGLRRLAERCEVMVANMSIRRLISLLTGAHSNEHSEPRYGVRSHVSHSCCAYPEWYRGHQSLNLSVYILVTVEYHQTHCTARIRLYSHTYHNPSPDRRDTVSAGTVQGRMLS